MDTFRHTHTLSCTWAEISSAYPHTTRLWEAGARGLLFRSMDMARAGHRIPRAAILSPAPPTGVMFSVLNMACGER